MKARKIGKNLHCSKFSTVNKNTLIGDFVKLNGCSISGNGNVYIGNHCVIGFDTLIISDTHNYKGSSLPYDGSFISRDTVIKDFVWVGARVIILPGTVIGEVAIIQAGAVVHGNIPALAIVGGNPAMPFKVRDKEHYEKLKSKMKLND